MNSYKKSLQMIISSDAFKKNISRILKKHRKDFNFDEELKDILESFRFIIDDVE